MSDLDSAQTSPTWLVGSQTRVYGRGVRRTRSLRRFALAAFTVALVGVVAGIASWLRPLPKPYFVPLWVTQYRSLAIPDRSEADQDRSLVRKAGLFSRFANANSSQEGTLLTRELEQLQRLEPGDKLVLYLSGFARVRGQGDIEFIPADAEPPGKGQGLSLREILRKVKASPPGAKLLVLDLAGPPREPRVGLLWSDPTSHVANLVAEVEAEHQAANPKSTPDWLVLCSAGPGQSPMGNRILGRTIFGYYFEMGLRGAAIPYNPDGDVGRRVTVRGLAAFLRARVDRWVRENDSRRQTPVLLGNGPDFDLVSASGGETPTPGIGSDEPLINSWNTLVRWGTERTLSVSPRIFCRLQDDVLVVQSGRQRGGSNDRGYADLAIDLRRLQRDMDLAQASPKRPAVIVSVALARVLGEKENQVAIEAVDALLSASHEAAKLPGTAREPIVAKATAAFVKSVTGQTPFAVESALLTRAEIIATRPSHLQVVDQALAERKVSLAYIESQFLRRLANLAKEIPASDWPADLARTAMTAVKTYESAAARPDVYPWTATALHRAAEARWTGEILLQFWGSVPADETLERFQDSIRLASGVIAFADAYAEARPVADQVLVSLIPEATILENFPDQVVLWKERLNSAEQLHVLLKTPTKPMEPGPLLEQADQLRRGAAATSRMTTALDRVIGTTDVDWTVKAAAAEPPPAMMLRKLEFLATLPRLTSQDREMLDRASRDLSRRLTERTIAADLNENGSGQRTLVVPFAPEETAAERQAAAERAAICAECHLEILRVAGLGATTVSRLHDLLQIAKRDGPGSPKWVDLSEALGQAWTNGFDQLVQDTPPQDRDLLALLWPGFRVSPFDSVDTDPRVVARTLAWSRFFGWSGVIHRQVARTGFDRDFLESVASAEIAVGVDTALAPPLVVFQEPPPLVLTSSDKGAEIQVRVRYPDPPSKDPVSIRVLPPGEGIQVTADPGSPVPDPAGGGTLSTITVRAQVVNPTQPGRVPDGVVIGFRAGRRISFMRVPIDASRLANPWEIIVDRLAVDPVGLGDSIRLRPGKGETLHVFVRNRSNEKRQALVRLKLPDTQPLDSTVTVGPGATVPAPFQGGPTSVTKSPTAGPGFPIPATLVIDLVDPKNPGDVLQSRTIQLSAREPYEYVDLVSSRFQPGSASGPTENRLSVSLRAIQDLGTIPSVAQLVIDPKLVPGLRGVRMGRFSGRIPAAGGRLELDATGLSLDPEASPEGQVRLTVDGVTRAFRLKVDFVRTGDAVSPVVDSTPNLELRPIPTKSPGQTISFQVGADRVVPGSTILTQLMRYDPGREPTEEMRQLQTAVRHQQGRVTPGPTGGLQFDVTIQDWELTWDVPQLLGRRKVVATLLGPDKTELSRREIPVILDDTPPLTPEFQGIPAQAQKGGRVPVSVEVSDPESGIDSVIFFVGKVGPDGKPPPGVATVPGVPSEPGSLRWSTTVPLPRDKLGLVDISCIATNGAGLATNATASVEVVEILPEKPGAIAGTLLEGNRAQSGIVVTLSDARGTALFRATTNELGAYLFPGLKPGAYKLTAEKVATRRKASADATVTPGSTTTADLNLYLGP